MYMCIHITYIYIHTLTKDICTFNAITCIYIYTHALYVCAYVCMLVRRFAQAIQWGIGASSSNLRRKKWRPTVNVYIAVENQQRQYGQINELSMAIFYSYVTMYQRVPNIVGSALPSCPFRRSFRRSARYWSGIHRGSRRSSTLMMMPPLWGHVASLWDLYIYVQITSYILDHYSL
jgi:hypothetical protein